MTTDPQPHLRHARLVAEEFVERNGQVPSADLRRFFEKLCAAQQVCDYQVDFDDRVLRFPCPLPRELPSLPKEYGFKGGAARLALRVALRLPVSEREVPRDVDLIRIGLQRDPRDWSLAKQYMPEDAAAGRSVEVTRSIPHYLRTRDLTLNEVLWIDNLVAVSFLGFIDTMAALIRPTKYRGGSLHSPKALRGVTVMKMLRLQAEFGSPWEVRGILPTQEVDGFDLALHLNRALARGEDVAHAFLKLAAQYQFAPDRYAAGRDGLIEAICDLCGEVDNGILFFTELSRELFTACEEYRFG